MKTKLLLLVCFVLSTMGAFAANPAFQDFYGTNGIIIRTNGNKVQVDGSALASTNAINPTTGFIPYRSNATQFGDSPLYRIATNRLGFASSNSVLYHDTAANNVGFGHMVMAAPGSSANNTIIGSDSGTNLAGTANGNTLVGSAAAPNLDSGDNNIGIGWFSLNALTSGSDNIGVGVSTLQSVVSGIDNTAVGRGSLDNATGSENTALGRATGTGMVGDGIRNTFLGAFADTFAARTNSTAVGYGSIITSNNQVVLGNGVSNYQFRGVNYIYPAAQGAFDTFLQNDGSGNLTWDTNLSLLVVTNLNVINTTVLSNVTIKGDLIVTNIVLGGANVRTNQYTTNISGTPVIGSFWFGGTNGAPVTNGPRNSAIEYIPVMRTFRQGDVGAQGAGHDSIDTQSVSNYWNATNQGFGSVAFGSNNWAWGNYSTIANGMFNIISSNAFGSFIGSGSNNVIHTNAFFSFIGSGDINKIRMNSRASVIVGGTANLITDSDFAFIGGGQSGQITGISDNSTIAGGAVNEIASGSVSSTIGGGDNNDISQSDNATIAGGDDNDIITTSDFGTIGGGSLNDLASAAYGTIAGGQANQMSAARGFIGGGNANFTASDAATIGGGVGNFISVNSGLSSILGGTSNRIEVAGATAIGNYLTNTTLRNVIEIGYGDAGGNNRKLQIDGTNGLRIRHYGGYGAVGGTYLITNTPIASAGAAETNLQVVTVGAHVLTNNNDRLLVRGSGNFAATSNTKQVQLVYGSEDVFDSGAFVANTGAWTLDCEIIRTGATAQSCNCSFNGGTNVVYVRTSALSTAQTNGIATVLKITGTAAGNGDITNRTLTVEWRPSI